jgi:lipoprotein signal peptidase
VVDFIDLQWFPIFNIADSAISLGAMLMIVASFRKSSVTDS